MLARNGAAPVGDLRYIADTKLDDLATPIAKAQIAAALGLLGDRARAERVYAAALDAIAPRPQLELVGRADYGSALRDAAALVTLAAEGGAPRPTITRRRAADRDGARADALTSTQENAWLVLAARAIAKDGERRVARRRRREPHQGALYRNVRASDLEAAAARSPIPATRRCRRWSRSPARRSRRSRPPRSGFKIERNFYTLDGEAADPSKVKQNDRFAVVLKITEPHPQFGRMLVADYLPAGFEIDNPRLVSSGDTGTLAWIEDAGSRSISEFRDDRFTAAFDRKAGDTAVFTVAYVVRAVSPGRYVVPQAYVEDMYRPDRFGRTGTGTIEVSGEVSERRSPTLPAAGRGTRRRAPSNRSCAGGPDSARRAARVDLSPQAGRGGRLRAVLAITSAVCDLGDVRRRMVGRTRSAPRRSVATSNTRPWCSTARAACCGRSPRCEGRWRLPATVADVDRRYFDLLLAYEDKRFR